MIKILLAKIKKIKKTKKIVISWVTTLIFLLILLGYSFLHPGKLTTIDSIRLSIQIKIMATLGDHLISDLYGGDKPTKETPNAITNKQLEKYINNLSPGNIFFTNSENYISSELIPGKWKHSVIYLGTQKQTNSIFKGDTTTINLLKPYYKTGDEKLIIDSSSHGVTIRNYQELSNLKEVSYLISLVSFRINTNKENIVTFLKYAIQQIGKGYDYDMITDNDNTLYCSELIYESLKKINIKLEPIAAWYGRKIISPNDIVSYIMTDGIDKKQFKFMFFIEKSDNQVIEHPLKTMEID